MKRKTIYIVFILLTMGWFNSFSQQDPMFSQYMFNTLSVNPGYAGSRGALSIAALSRWQWVGLDGAPVTQTITAHTPFLNEKLGIGATIVKDQIGPVNQTFGYLDMAYHMTIDKQSKLSFGLKGGLTTYQIRFSSLNNIESNDPITNLSDPNKLTPNVGAGLYYYRERFYVGISAPKLLAYQYESGVTNAAKQQQHFFGIIGFVKDISYVVKYKPTALVKMVQGAPIQLDLTNSLLLWDKFWVGAMYRSGDAIGGLVQIQATEQLRIGYAYDHPITAINGLPRSGSHELMIGYDFIYSEKKKYRSPRYF